MEAKLKALKVPDLKEILKRASVSAPPKANKADLVAKILAEPAAIDAYNALHNPGAATPQQVASSKPKPAAKPPLNPPVSPKKVQDPAPPPKPAPTTVPTTTEPTDTTSVQDPELEKRKARAARFGIPLVDPNQAKTTGKEPDEARLKARAERFGTDVTAERTRQPGRKRGAPDEPVDTEELERRRKRAERFGVPLAGTSKA